jgi:hypothetical protein
MVTLLHFLKIRTVTIFEIVVEVFRYVYVPSLHVVRSLSL